MTSQDLYPFPMLNSLEGLYEEVLESDNPVAKEEYLNPNYDKRYRYVKDIGKGGIKKVSLETDICTNRDVAVYRLLKKNSENEANLINEAHNTAKLEHNNILPIYDFGFHNGEFYYTSKYLDGEDFKSFLSDKYTLASKLEVMLKICDAMNYAHSKSVVHLDLKPANIHLTSYNQVMVIDWGLSKDLSKNTYHCEDKFSGTPGYCSPEQILQSEVNQKADIYALGAMLYEILTGQQAWASPTIEEVAQKTLIGDLSELEKVLKSKQAPKSLISVCLNAMESKQEDRYDSVLAFQNELQRYLKGFTTVAEEATYLKQFLYLFKRHKNAFAFCFLIAFSIGFLLSHFQQKLKISNQNIARLSKGKAHTLFEKSVKDFKKLELQSSHEKILASLKLNPTAEGKLHLAKTFLSLGQKSECIKILKSLDDNKDAQELLAILDMNLDFGKFFKQLLIQKKIYLARNIVKYKRSQIPDLQSKISFSTELFRSLGLRGLEYDISQENGLLKLLSAKNLYRSMPVIGLDFSHINFSNNPISSIESLRGMYTLKYLNLSNTYVRDLTPLEGMELDYLNISDSCAVELRDLDKTYVKVLDLSGLKVRYLLTLKDMKNIKKVIINEENLLSTFDQKAYKFLSAQNRIILN